MERLGLIALLFIGATADFAYGPDGCVHVSRSTKGSCVFKTSCLKDISKLEFSFICAEADGEQVEHIFERGALAKSDHWDSDVKCSKCLAPTMHHVLVKEDENKDEKETETEEETTETDAGACQCVGMPDSLKNNATALGTYPATYGETCAAHDLETSACSGEFKPAWCYEKWCYVDPACAVGDKKETFFFQGYELYYSYQHCGSLDAFAASKCGEATDAASCTAISSNCAFNQGICQNKLCTCTGDNSLMGADALAKYGSEYGKSCSNWDQSDCAKWESEGTGYDLGLWCCKDWCYVAPECPSAEVSELHEGLAYSYLACPDDADHLEQCPWKEPIEFNSEPLMLTGGEAAALNEEALKETALKMVAVPPATAAVYGPSDCVSTYKGPAGTCIMETACTGVSMGDYTYGLMCVDSKGDRVRHVFMGDAFAPVETFDTLIACDMCLGLDAEGSVGLGAEVSALKAEVETLSEKVASLEGGAAPAPSPAPEANSTAGLIHIKRSMSRVVHGDDKDTEKKEHGDENVELDVVKHDEGSKFLKTKKRITLSSHTDWDPLSMRLRDEASRPKRGQRKTQRNTIHLSHEHK